MELKYVANHGIVEQIELGFNCCVDQLIIKLFMFGRTIFPNEYQKYNEYNNITANNDRKYIYRSSQPWFQYIEIPDRWYPTHTHSSDAIKLL